MKKITCIILLISSSFLFAIDDIVDKDHLHNLIEGINSTRFGSDRITTIYNLSPLFNHNTPLKIGGGILDLSHIVDNSFTNSEGKRKLAFLPKFFVGMSYGIFGFGYQFNLYNDLTDFDIPIAHSHSLSFGFVNDRYRLSFPISFSFADKNYYAGKLSISTSPKFSWMFRGGLLDEFSFTFHYGIQLSTITNDIQNTKVAPMVIGGSLYANLMLTRFDNYPIQISIPAKVAFYYGIGSRWATIDAGYASDALTNYLYDNNGSRSDDSIYFYILAPVKFEAKLGAIYTYIMPRLMFEGQLYKTDGLYNFHYGIEGELRVTLIENLTFGLTAFAEGQGIMKKNANFNFYNAFDGGIDVWGIWRY